MKTFIFTLALSFSMSALAASEGYRRESSALGDKDSIPQEVERRSPGVQREEDFGVRGSRDQEFGHGGAVNDVQREEDLGARGTRAQGVGYGSQDYGPEQRAEDIRIPESEDPGMDYGQFGDDVQREEDIIEVDGFSDEAYEPIGEDQIEINN